MYNDDHPLAPRQRGGRFARIASGLIAAAALVAGAVVPTTALAGAGPHDTGSSHYAPAIKVVAITPRPGDIAGTGGTFNVDLALLAQNSTGNSQLSTTSGYKSGLNLPPATTFGPGLPDPDAPGLVVTLSSTPQAAGGPNANLAGVFQLNTVARHNGLKQVYTDWEVGSPGFFGTGKQVTLTAYVVKGTAPGMVTGNEKPISNVLKERFTIGR
jgi:hypothetical protein